MGNVQKLRFETTISVRVKRSEIQETSQSRSTFQTENWRSEVQIQGTEGRVLRCMRWYRLLNSRQKADS